MPRRVKLAKLSVEDLKQEISRRQKALPKLIAKRDCLNCQIAELEGLGAVKPIAAKRPKEAGKRAGRKDKGVARTGSLATALIEALKANPKLTVAQAAEAVKLAGYKSKSKNFATIVGMTLGKSSQFKRVGRGVYKLKG